MADYITTTRKIEASRKVLDEDTKSQVVEYLEKSKVFIDDVLSQVGGLFIQDLSGLNDMLILQSVLLVKLQRGEES